MRRVSPGSAPPRSASMEGSSTRRESTRRESMRAVSMGAASIKGAAAAALAIAALTFGTTTNAQTAGTNSPGSAGALPPTDMSTTSAGAPAAPATSAVPGAAAASLASGAPAIRSDRSLPLWEAGLGLGTFTVPDYRGSNERRGYALPFPYVVYRGDYLKVDREGLRARLFDDERFDIELSAAATFALRASENKARQGMSELRTIGEIGPEFVYRIVDGKTSPVGIDFRLATRAAFSIGGGRIGYEGWTALPSLRFLAGNVAGTGFDGLFSIGALYGSRGYNAYYYGVDQQYVTPDRAAYEAKGGYGGLQMIAGTSRRLGDVWIGAYLRYDSLNGASFENSPLVKTRSYVTAGIAVAYVFGKSEQRVMPSR